MTIPQRSLLWRQCAIAATVVLGLLAVSFRSYFPTPLYPALHTLPTVVMCIATIGCPSNESPRYRWAIIVALAMSCVADVALGRHFLTGIAIFLAACAAYLAAFTSDVRFAKRLAPFACYGLIGGAVLAFVWPYLPKPLLIPVMLYGLAIIAVPAQAVVRGLVVRQSLISLAAAGATLLFVSDSALGIRHFVTDFAGAHLLIMSTYYGGQWLIAMSVFRRA
jgi:uncharacterized membrane protein YhhN